MLLNRHEQSINMAIYRIVVLYERLKPLGQVGPDFGRPVPPQGRVVMTQSMLVVKGETRDFLEQGIP